MWRNWEVLSKTLAAQIDEDVLARKAADFTEGALRHVTQFASDSITLLTATSFFAASQSEAQKLCC